MTAADGGLHRNNSVASVLTDNPVNYWPLAAQASTIGHVHGSLTGVVLIQAAMELKREYTQSGEPDHRAFQKSGSQLQAST